ncbi:MAG TPA: transglutaminase-like domain-containing protein [Planctomycetota bacterium]
MKRPVPMSLARRTAALLLLCCTTLALANLPASDLPLGWLLAFTLPGATLGLLRKKAARPWDLALLGILLQAGACYLALEVEGPMTRPAALACTILPPLAFVTTRREESDLSLGLFLSFCVLLVGIILDGIHLPLIAAYAGASCLSLYNAAHLTARAASRRPAPTPSERPRLGDVLVSSGGIALACLLSAFAIERALGLLPSPTGPRGSAVSSPTDSRSTSRTVGLGESFVLGGSQGVLAELRGERLLRARSPDGSPVAADLYLRSGFFAVPGLDRWQTGPLTRTKVPSTVPFVLRPPEPRVPVETLRFERLAGSRNFVFVPPDTCEVRGLEGLYGDAARGWLRQEEGLPQEVYEVVWQRLDGLPAGPLDPNAASQGLLSVPDGFDRAPFHELLEAWQVGDPPRTAMERIAAGLRRHCRYDRSEPIGPHPLALQNFLFAAEDRRGYCMHFASAAALMLRLRGIPCRIAVGVYGGEADAEVDGARSYGSQHAHAWVEVRFQRRWVVFDPTPPAERGRRAPIAAEPAPASEAPDAEAAESGDLLAETFDLLTRPWLLAVALLLALLTALWPAGSPRPAHGITPTGAKSARRLLVRLLRALADAGHLRRHGQTLESFARELGRQKRLLPEVSAAMFAYQEVRFGGCRLDAGRESVLLRGIEAASGLRAMANRD